MDDGRVSEGARPEAGQLPVVAVGLGEQARVALERSGPSLAERVDQHVGSQQPALERVLDAVAQYGASGAGSIADHHERGSGLGFHRPAHGQTSDSGCGLWCRRVEAPSLGHSGGPAVEQAGGVHTAEVAGGAEQGDAHVHGAVAQWHDPAVAGDGRALAVGELETHLDTVVVVTCGGEVAPDGGAVRPPACARGAEGAAERAVGSVGHHQEPGAQFAHVADGRAHDGAAYEPALDDRLHRLVPIEQRRARSDGMLCQSLVEGASAHCRTDDAELRMVGPLEVARLGAGCDAQARGEVRIGEHSTGTQAVECGNGPGGERVAARLRSRERPTFEHHHVRTVLGEATSHGRTGRAGADDEDVGGVVHVGEPRARSAAMAQGALPALGSSPTPMEPSIMSPVLAMVMEPSSMPNQAGASGLHQVSYSSA